MKKRLISMLLLVVMVLGMLPATALAASSEEEALGEVNIYNGEQKLYETRRMLYTLYNAIGDNPETWQNGQPVKFPSGNDKVKINLTIPAEVTPQSFWPWRAEQIIELFNSCPPGTYSLEAWNVYKNGVFQYTEYSIHVS